MNECVKKQWAPEHLTQFAIELAEIAAEFAQGTFSVVGLGTLGNWGLEGDGFDKTAKQHFDELVKSSHPIYDPQHAYSKIQMSHHKSAIKVDKRSTGEYR